MGGSLALVVVGGLTTRDGARANHAAIHGDGGLAWVGAWEIADLLLLLISLCLLKSRIRQDLLPKDRC